MKRLMQNTKSIEWIRQKLAAAINPEENDKLITPIGSIVFIILAGLFALYLQLRPVEKAEAAVAEPLTIDKNIPPGYSMLPIEIINPETLDSIVGTFSMVNLYTVPVLESQKAKAIARKVKLFRHPQNPSHFAALLKEAQVTRIIRYPGPYKATVLNPNFKAGTEIEKEIRRKRSRVRYLGD